MVALDWISSDLSHVVIMRIDLELYRAEIHSSEFGFSPTLAIMPMVVNHSLSVEALCALKNLDNHQFMDELEVFVDPDGFSDEFSVAYRIESVDGLFTGRVVRPPIWMNLPREISIETGDLNSFVDSIYWAVRRCDGEVCLPNGKVVAIDGERMRFVA